MMGFVVEEGGGGRERVEERERVEWQTEVEWPERAAGLLQAQPLSAPRSAGTEAAQVTCMHPGTSTTLPT